MRIRVLVRSVHTMAGNVPATGLYEALRFAIDRYGANDVQRALDSIITHPTRTKPDEVTEKFQAAVHKMRDAFYSIKVIYENTEPERFGTLSRESDNFFDGYQQTKRIFGDILMQRDVFRGMYD